MRQQSHHSGGVVGSYFSSLHTMHVTAKIPLDTAWEMGNLICSYACTLPPDFPERQLQKKK